MRPRSFAAPAEPTVTLTIGIEVFGERVAGDFEVPAGPVRPRRLLPVVRALAETVVERSILRAEREGLTVSCGAGCGACCRQLVPVSRTETHAIRDLVDTLPAAKRAAVQARFADARRRLDEAGMLARLSDPPSDDDGKHALAIEYMALGIACPFLEQESCSIHPERPVVCREYLVTSPPAYCASPTPDTVKPVMLSSAVSERIPRMEAPLDGATWVPLVLAPAWADEHPEEIALRPAPELLGALLAPPKKSSADRRHEKTRRKSGKRRR